MLFNKGIIFQNEAAGFAYQILNKYPEIAKAVAQRFPIIIIDEVQDTSATQMAVFDLLAESGMKSMFLVGDPDQSIYEWRNANPECMIQKIEAPNWRKIGFTGNFRSSQNICNATSFFSASLMGKKQSIALGAYKDEAEKPVLLLTDESDEERVIDYFLDKCTKMGITISSENVAVLTRGRIYSETQIVDLWKSKEINSFAKAAYEWTFGSRRKTYREVSKAAFNLIFNKDVDEYTMVQIIREQTDEDTWKDFLINVLVDMPDVKIGLEEWVKTFSAVFDAVCTKYNYKISEDKNQKEIFKIKQRDKGSTEFKKIPLWKFFEKKTEDRYTRSSIHGVKGESYDAVLIYIASRKGSTITPKFLMEGNLGQELMRVAYVAMTRPRRLLMLAMPDTKEIRSCGRFSDTYWTYEDLYEVSDCK